MKNIFVALLGVKKELCFYVNMLIYHLNWKKCSEKRGDDNDFNKFMMYRILEPEHCSV